MLSGKNYHYLFYHKNKNNYVRNLKYLSNLDKILIQTSKKFQNFENIFVCSKMFNS